jgi:hypothetical protein
MATTLREWRLGAPESHRLTAFVEHEREMGGDRLSSGFFWHPVLTVVLVRSFLAILLMIAVMIGARISSRNGIKTGQELLGECRPVELQLKSPEALQRADYCTRLGDQLVLKVSGHLALLSRAQVDLVTLLPRDTPESHGHSTVWH